MNNNMRAIHPSEILKDEIACLELSANKFAGKLNVPTNRITAILNGQRSITADTAFRLAIFFDTTAEFWLHLQADYDLKLIKQQFGKKILKEIQQQDAA